MSRLLIALPLLALTAVTASAQVRKPIEAQDGDVVLIRDAARIRIVRRSEGNVRAIYNGAQRWLVVLLDQAKGGAPPDGRVDVTYNFNDVEGEWPLGERWDGYATVDDYSVPGEMTTPGIGLTTAGGLVQVLPGPRSARGSQGIFKDPAAVATVTISGAGRGSGSSYTFEQAEAQVVGVAMRNAANVPPPGFRSSVNVTPASGAATRPPGAYPPPNAPVRVGGNITQPARIQDAEPVLPEIARQANVRGVVIVEITIGVDGAVTNAKVLRSIPLLDQAALDAVRQWRFEPTLLNGAPVPVILTATVNFR